MAGGCDLTYNVVEMTLQGSLDGVRIDARAVSGGRAGSKQKNVVHPMPANNPFATGIKLSKDNPGGTLPLGAYALKTHEQASKPAPTLEVVAIGDIDAIEEKMRTWMSTA